MVSPPPQIIISEAHLPLAEKTIKPVAVGGIAGGEKYVSQGILFKVHRLAISGTLDLATHCVPTISLHSISRYRSTNRVGCMAGLCRCVNCAVLVVVCSCVCVYVWCVCVCVSCASAHRSAQNDERAMKGAVHELKGVMAVYQVARRLPLGICLPLLAMVDYRGYRLLATRCAQTITRKHSTQERRDSSYISHQR